MNPDAVEHGLVAKRGLPADLHDPIPSTRWQPVSWNSGSIARETPGVVISLLMGIDTTAKLVGCKMVWIPDPPPNPFWQKKLNDGGPQFQFTLFYRLLP
jgi:hypothetical protein